VRVFRRFRRERKTPLAIASILAMPLFFASLMAFSLAVEKPTIVIEGGKPMLGDPSGSTEASIWGAAFAVVALLLVVGLLACLLPSRFALALPAATAIAVALALRLPLERWEERHTLRYPEGVDLIPRSDPGDLFLRGEWEENARRTVEQLSFWTIAIAVGAVVGALLLELRRRRGPAPPPVPPPPRTVAGGTPT
jgi:hypothetical protein